MNEPLNVKLGVCKIYAGGTDLGFTIGGVEVTYSPEYQETKVDQLTGIVERFLIGEKLSAKVPLAEFVVANLKASIPHGTQVGKAITVGGVTGRRSSPLAVQIRLHPIANADNDKTDDVILHKATNTAELTIGHKNDGEKILECTFEAYSDNTKPAGNMLGLIGDSLA